jgi:hypothetical protein
MTQKNLYTYLLSLFLVFGTLAWSQEANLISTNFGSSINQTICDGQSVTFTIPQIANDSGVIDNEFERSVIPRHSYLLLYGSLANFNNAQYLSLSEEVQFGEFSLGISQQLSNVETINLNNIGMSVGLSLENFDFGIFYNFPIRQASRVFSPSIFELNLIFNFSQFRRNNRGLYKRLQTDNYF